MLQHTSNGIVYDIAGEGPAVLLIHAGIADHRMWDAAAARLVDTHTVVRPDLRGFGASPVPDRPFRHVDDVRDVLDAVGVASATVVGNSFGGRVAYCLAANYPERVDRLVVLSASVDGWTWSAEAEAYGEAEERALEAGDLKLAARLNEDIWVRGPQREWTGRLRALAGELAAPLRTALVNQAETGKHEMAPDLAPLEQMRVPTVIGIGRLDLPDFVGMADELARRIPGATLVEFPDAAHLLPLEEPDLIAELAL